MGRAPERFALVAVIGMPQAPISARATSLSGIRSRGTSVRVLEEMTDEEQDKWEGFNYGMMGIILGTLSTIWRFLKHNEAPMKLLPQRQIHESDVNDEEGVEDNE